jgi:alpha-L-rhamnosidase
VTRIAPGSLRFEHLREPLGVGTATPRISWRVEDAPQGWEQTAREIEAHDPESGALAWTTGRVSSSLSVLVPWAGPPLQSRQRLAVRARAWGPGGEATGWSQPAIVEAGLLSPADWIGRFVGPAWEETAGEPRPCPYLRKEFHGRAGLARARLYATALGVYEVEVNGRRVGDHVLAPGWTSYDHRLRYQAFDVTTLIREGPNAIGAVLGDGWYRGRIGFPGQSGEDLWGERLAFLAQLELTYADGTRAVVATDSSWRASTGPLLASSLYDGESYDARREMPGWSSPGFDDAGWEGVVEVERDLATLVAPEGPPVRRVEAIEPASVAAMPSGATLVDFGQNLAGVVRLTVEGPPGTEVTLRHAEVLERGELCTRPLRGAKATDRYILRGGGLETWEPRFTYHGFRYAEVSGWPGEVQPGALRAVVCHSDLERTGWFECSEPLLNRFHENVVWSMRSNFFDVPTDCPQRDERLGWTGDIAVFAPAACYLYDTAGFLSTWLADLAADQDAGGGVPVVVPDALGRRDPARIPFRGLQAIWGDAAVIVPWVLYERYGDEGILARQYASMKAWIDAVARAIGPARRWEDGFQLADWLDPAAPPERPAQAMTDPHLVATAYFAHAAGLLAKAAAVLGHGADADRYATLAAEVRDAFRHEYVTPSGRLVSDSQTAYALALAFGLVDGEEERAVAGRRLEALVRRNDYRVGTGFAGTPIILDALCLAGAEEAAVRMLLTRECPSWLYPLTMGATTVWERWDSLRPDGSVNPGQMTSFNHYALGAVADFIHRRIGGLAPLEPGYRRFEVAPIAGLEVTWAKARLRTPYGLAAVEWRREDGRLELDVTVPPSARAVVRPPAGGPSLEAASGAHHWSLPLR